MQDICSSSWRMPYNEKGSTSDQPCGLSELKPAEYSLDMLHLASDQSPLISKMSSGFPCLKDRDECCQFTSKRMEKMKNWLWMKHQHQFVSRPHGWLQVNWLRSLQRWKNLIKNPFRKWLKCRRKQRLCVHTECVQAALSVASLSAALATIAAATAIFSADELDSKNGLVVASAAALVAAHCADYAKQIGADQDSVLASVSAGGSVQRPTDVQELTTSAAASLQEMRCALKRQKGTHIHVPGTAGDGKHFRSSALSQARGWDHAESVFNNEILTRGAYFLVRFTADKVHRRFISVCLENNKQVTLKLISRHFAGAVHKVEKREILQALGNLPPWPGRGLLYNGVERSYFGLRTPEGIVEVECLSNYDHELWTMGISHLLNVATAVSR